MPINAFGTKLQLGDGSPTTETFTDIAEITSISPPSLSKDTIETTTHNSVDRYKEFISGLRDAGEVSLDINYDPADATHNLLTGLLGEYEKDAPSNYKIIFPDSGTTTWSFAGILTSFEASAPIDDKLTASITIKISGKPTLA